MRFALFMLVAVAAELVIFRYAYRDLVYLHQPITQIVNDPRGQLRQYGAAALSRPHLTRGQLETLTQAAWQTGDPELHPRALTRLAQEYPDDQRVQLRLAESLRLEGRLDEAAAIYRRVLEREAVKSQ